MPDIRLSATPSIKQAASLAPMASMTNGARPRARPAISCTRGRSDFASRRRTATSRSSVRLPPRSIPAPGSPLLDLLGLAVETFLIEHKPRHGARGVLDECHADVSRRAEELRRIRGQVLEHGLAGRFQVEPAPGPGHGDRETGPELVFADIALEDILVHADRLPLDRRPEPGHGPLRLEGVKAEVVDAEGCVAQDDDPRLLFRIEAGERPVPARAAVVPDDLR